MVDPDARMDRLRRAARYRIARAVEEDIERGSIDPDAVREERRRVHAKDLAARADALVRDGEQRGVFDGNPYRGRPLPGNDGRHDPDWWVRSYIEREQLTGLGPPALMLRREDAELDGRLDEETSERAIRRIIAEFNERIADARRQLLGGPPVVTHQRDPDTEVERWRHRRELRERRTAEENKEETRSGRRWRRWLHRSERRNV